MSRSLLLVLEDEAGRTERFTAVIARLKRPPELVVWRTAHDRIRELPPLLLLAAIISLDHDLEAADGASDPGDGLMVAKHLVGLRHRHPVVIHTSNGLRGDMMQGEFDLAGWTCRRVLPLGDDWVEESWYPVVRRLLKPRREPNL